MIRCRGNKGQLATNVFTEDKTEWQHKRVKPVEYSCSSKKTSIRNTIAVCWYVGSGDDASQDGSSDLRVPGLGCPRFSVVATYAHTAFYQAQLAMNTEVKDIGQSVLELPYYASSR